MHRQYAVWLMQAVKIDERCSYIRVRGQWLTGRNSMTCGTEECSTEKLDNACSWVVIVPTGVHKKDVVG